MKKIIFYSSILTLMVSMSSCAHRLVDFTVISTKNVPITDNFANLKKATTRVKGEDRSHTLLYFPLGSPNMKEAIDRAIEQYPGAVGLVDGVVKSKNWWAILYGQSAYIVEGTPIYLDKGSESQSDYSPAPQINNQQNNTLLFFHEVKKNETLQSIATLYNVKIGDIIKWNKLSSNAIEEGAKLQIFINL
ncbi:MAG: LysM peptidoglycan-binding domain-containing protein [Coprobacter sp.]|nr:LysM peptidoglycan-binding domain-containing protein [Coprobacter sp.]